MIADPLVATENPVRDAERAQVAAGLRLDQHIDNCAECFGVVQCRPGYADFCEIGRKLEKQWRHLERKVTQALRTSSETTGR